MCISQVLLVAPSAGADADAGMAAVAVNRFGWDLFRRLPAQGNLCVSPYSIQSALAMTWLGACGDTEAQMARVLHYDGGKDALAASFEALHHALADLQEKAAQFGSYSPEFYGTAEPLVIRLANRLYAQKGLEWRPAYVEALLKHFAAPADVLDFAGHSDQAAAQINSWVEERTQGRIQALFPPGTLGADTRMVLVNALYFKAFWNRKFEPRSTRAAPFHLSVPGPPLLAAGEPLVVDVPMMFEQTHMGYFKGEGLQAVTVDYFPGSLHFLLIVPDALDGLAAVMDGLDADQLAAMGQKAVQQEVKLHLPKFRLQSPGLSLAPLLKAMGMTAAFDAPRGSANFDGMTSRRDEDYLFLSEVRHKTFIEWDEQGTEAAAATAVEGRSTSGPPGVKIIPKVMADRPFLFAIQHQPTGACLFLGRVTDPRVITQ
jgi:serpin B